MEAIDLEMEIIKPIIGRMTGPIIEGRILTKIMAKETEEIEVLSRECERSRPRHRNTSRDISINRYRTNKTRSRDRG